MSSCRQAVQVSWRHAALHQATRLVPQASNQDLMAKISQLETLVEVIRPSNSQVHCIVEMHNLAMFDAWA